MKKQYPRDTTTHAARLRQQKNRSARRQSAERTLTSLKQDNLGQLLLKTARLYDAKARGLLDPAQAAGVTRAHLALFAHIDLEGTRLTDIAGRAGISKQAVSQLVKELERLQVLERLPDPADGRAVMIRFSDFGLAALGHGLSMLREVETQVQRAIGAGQTRQLKQLLATVLDSGALDA